MKGRKRWLIALLAALAAAIPALVPELAPLIPVIDPVIERQSEQEAAEAVVLDPRQCASNWSACPPTPSADLHSQRR